MQLVERSSRGSADEGASRSPDDTSRGGVLSMPQVERHVLLLDTLDLQKYFDHKNALVVLLSACYVPFMFGCSLFIIIWYSFAHIRAAPSCELAVFRVVNVEQQLALSLFTANARVLLIGAHTVLSSLVSGVSGLSFLATAGNMCKRKVREEVPRVSATAHTTSREIVENIKGQSILV